MDLELRGKCAVAVGGSKGIGLAIARCLARESADVEFAREENGPCRGRTLAARLRRPRVRATCDAADGASLDGFLEQAHAFLGRIDILVNNASAFGFTDDASGWQASFDVDARPPSAPAGRSCRGWRTPGAVASSTSPRSGSRGRIAAGDAAAKAALVSHAKTLALSLAAKRIRVNAVAPALIDFEGGAWDRVKTPTGRSTTVS